VVRGEGRGAIGDLGAGWAAAPRRFVLPARTARLLRLWPMAPAALVLGGLFLFPLAIVLLFSFWQTNQNFAVVVGSWTLANYQAFFANETYVRTFVKTVAMAGVVTAAGLGVAFPFAYFLVRYVARRWQRLILLAVVIPFWTSYLLRAYSWQAILDDRGALNQLLVALGLPTWHLLYTNVSVAIVLLYVYLPFAILALYASLEKFDFNQLTAAQDLGATPLQAFRRILVPQIRPGIITACIFVFIPILGEYLTPTLVGGTEGVLIANLVVNFFRSGLIPLGTAASFLIAAAVTVLLILFRRYLRVEDVVAR
jgi:ABC-type spermidine/putrescine transport system permease subunit I